MKANQLQKYISERIRECRKERNLSQEQLSSQAGLGIKAIQNIENLKYDFKIQTLEKVLTALNMTVEDFLIFLFLITLSLSAPWLKTYPTYHIRNSLKSFYPSTKSSKI
ncbi:helix-turn-helix transcriptional regulator [Streptococcus anginosus]|uniref:helix-turn-helix domain-containing protein n=1 Tax=Streptococcus anginosus TaxID=1328 RepID=UPI0021F8C38F|nr:helix-turn-helix transcriptional regulator [Streptococcus anginosus]MCW1059242.1 helix-turn-helix transcriptional regulator [Streptococcus anginosus]